MQDDRDRITGRLDEALPARVSPLRSLHNHRITEGDPDVRGWEVYGADGRRIGQVDDLLIDTEAGRARYLAVTLGLGDEGVTAPMPAEPGPIAFGAPLTATSAMGGLSPVISETAVRNTLTEDENRLTVEDRGPSRRILIPIGQARLDPQRDRIVVEGLRADAAAGLPDYDGGEISSHGDDFYADDLYNEDRFYSARRTARVAGLEPGRGTTGGPDREITGELDRAVDAPDHNVQEETPLRGR
ncbi:MAG TPA: PRC-barrel domain-containing protein [Thermoanaerobaculia bacterium]|nr:PRC-barrel domain-containing protein [Thermoanaerobaculia bacterium]